jgi:hypothetical protein
MGDIKVVIMDATERRMQAGGVSGRRGLSQ